MLHSTSKEPIDTLGLFTFYVNKIVVLCLNGIDVILISAYLLHIPFLTVAFGTLICFCIIICTCHEMVPHLLKNTIFWCFLNPRTVACWNCSFFIIFKILAIFLSLHWIILSILCQKYTWFKFYITYLVNKMIKFLFSIMFNILFRILFFNCVNLAIQ